jgi:uncharacterized membrane protein YfcA
MDWLHILMPIAGVPIFWPGLIILGFGVGIIGGFFGQGGAWMVTPGLNILGFPMAFAIGTDVTHMAGKSLISTMRHSKFGNVDFKLGSTMVLGTVVGIEIGAQGIMWLERLGKVNLYVRSVYVVLLALIAWMVFADIAKRRKKEREALASGRKLDGMATGIEWYKKLHAINIPPMVTFPTAGVHCSLWLPVAVSVCTGLLAGFLGIGGGLICMPALIYLIGCPTHVAVGTDLFNVAVAGLYGAATYGYKGRVELLAALVMLLGAAVGAQIGTVATKYVKGYGIRIFFGVAVVGCGLSVILKLISAAYKSVAPVTDLVATVLILGLVSAISFYILIAFLKGASEERSRQRALKSRASAAY